MSVAVSVLCSFVERPLFGGVGSREWTNDQSPGIKVVKLGDMSDVVGCVLSVFCDVRIQGLLCFVLVSVFVISVHGVFRSPFGQRAQIGCQRSF